MPDDDNIKWMPTKDLHQEEGAHELATSPSMEPYLNFAAALIQGNDPEPELGAIRQLPVEKRYVWRVASALCWAFADLDDFERERRQADTDPRGLRQGDGSSEIAAHADGPVFESAGGHRRNAAADGRGDQGGETAIVPAGGMLKTV